MRRKICECVLILFPILSASALPKPDCHFLFQSFCETLYSPENDGNYKVGAPPYEVQAKYGDDELGNNWAWRVYSEKKIKALKDNRFPKDLLQNLKNYPDVYQKQLESNRHYPMPFARRLDLVRIAKQLDFLWNKAFRLTQMERTEKQYSGYYSDHREKRDPVTVLKVIKLEKELQMEVNRCIWDQSSEFLNAKKEFDTLKIEYLKWIQSEAEISSTVKKFWLERMSALRIVAPSTESNLMDGDDCAIDKKDAFYNVNENAIVVCAGLLSSQTTLYPVLAHEIAHSLGLNADLYWTLKNSNLVKLNRALIEEECRPSKAFSCPEAWQSLIDAFPSESSYLLNFQTPLRSLRTELMNTLTPLKPIWDTDKNAEKVDYSNLINEDSEKESRKRVAFLAHDTKFSDLLSLKSVERYYRKKDGSRKIIRFDNPQLRNPCATGLDLQSDDYFPNSILSTRAHFLAAYECSSPAQDEYVKVKMAAQKSQELLAVFYKNYFRTLRQFATLSEVNRAGYAHNVEERFADALGVSMTSRVLKGLFESGASLSIAKRRNWFFMGSSLFCSQKTLQDEHPQWARAEKEISNEPHSENWFRRKELIRKPLDEVLDCSLE